MAEKLIGFSVHSVSGRGLWRLEADRPEGLPFCASNKVSSWQR